MHLVRFSTPSRTLFAAPFWIAQALGYFAEEGLEASLDIIGDNRLLKHRLRVGEHQFSIDTPDGVILDALSGGPLRIVAGNACRPPLFVISRPHITMLSQLRGATIGVMSREEGSSKLIPKILAAAGLSIGDVEIREVGGAPARQLLLTQGSIDVGLQPMPLSCEAEDASLNNLGWTGELEPYWQFTTINANIEWAQNEPAVVAGVIRSLRRAMSAMTSFQQSAAIVAPHLSCEVGHAETALQETVRLGILDPELNISTSGMGKVLANLRLDESLPPSPHTDWEGGLEVGLPACFPLATCASGIVPDLGIRRQ
jgi:NitT/TauT family transport system substrate-binding protein